MAMSSDDATIPPFLRQPDSITANLSLPDLTVELELRVDHDATVGLLWIELVRGDAALPPARLVLAQDPALDLALRLTGTVMRLRGQTAP
jgi:hypothetical protein